MESALFPYTGINETIIPDGLAGCSVNSRARVSQALEKHRQQVLKFRSSSLPKQ